MTIFSLNGKNVRVLDKYEQEITNALTSYSLTTSQVELLCTLLHLSVKTSHNVEGGLFIQETDTKRSFLKDALNDGDFTKLVEVVSHYNLTKDQIEVLKLSYDVNTFMFPLKPVAPEDADSQGIYSKRMILDFSKENIEAVLEIVSKHHLSADHIKKLQDNTLILNDIKQLDAAMLNLEKYDYAVQPWSSWIGENILGYTYDPKPLVEDINSGILHE